MKNFNELFLENREKKIAEADREKELLVERLANDIKRLITDENFMKEAEEALTENGCFKICHSAAFIKNKIYIITETDCFTDDEAYSFMGFGTRRSKTNRSADSKISCFVDDIFSKEIDCQKLNIVSERVQEAIGKEFIDFWAERGVHVMVSLDGMFFIVNSLWEKANEAREKANMQIMGYNASDIFPELKFNKMAKKIDILKYVSRPFCCFE